MIATTQVALSREVSPAASSEPVMLRFTVTPDRCDPQPIIKAIAFAEAFRGAVLANYTQTFHVLAPQRLAGKNPDGSMRRGWDHPSYLALDLSGRGVIDAIDVFLPCGYSAAEYKAITSASYVYDMHRFQGRYAVAFVGIAPSPFGQRWETETPIVLDRFPKHRGPGKSVTIDGPEEQIRSALFRLGFDGRVTAIRHPGTPVSMCSLSIDVGCFERERKRGGPAYLAVGATIEFDREVRGPILLGRLSHFGLGRFAPI